MKIMIAYDIKKNKIRNGVIDILLDYSFIRIQKSVFIGEADKNKLKKILYLLRDTINRKEDSLYIFNICDKDFNNAQFLGKIINSRFINEEIIFF